MLKRKLFLAGILAAVMLAGAVGCTQAQIQALQGTLQNIDSVSGNVTVKLKDGTTQSFNLTDVKVDTVAQALGKASLEIGDAIVVKARKNGEVEGVETEKAEVGGVIKSLGANNVTITTKKDGDITLLVTLNTTIRDRGAANFSALQVGQRVEVKYEISTKTALRINVNYEDAEGQVSGVISAIDSANKTVTINATRKGEITLQVTANTSIRIEEKGTATFSDLKVGQRIEARYDVATLTAIKLTAENTGEENKEKGKDNAQATENRTSANRTGDNRDNEDRNKGRDR